MTFESFLAQHSPAILVEVTATKGSTPRDTGTFMLVSTDGFWGTIGGGNLEFVAIEHARDMLAGRQGGDRLTVTLGSDSGQCCGGVVYLGFKPASEPNIAVLKLRLANETGAFPDVFLFGAGHVGRALSIALKPLPFRTVVIETRREELDLLDTGIETRLAAMPETLVGEISSGGAAVILTHDHALDFLIGAEALKRDDLAYIGMIGSKTKRGVFSNWLVREGLGPTVIDRLVLPIGGTVIKDKRPEVIAALVAAELLTALI